MKILDFLCLSQGETKALEASKSYRGCAKRAPLSHLESVEGPTTTASRSMAEIKFKIFSQLTEMRYVYLIKEHVMTITATNALILGAVFMFAARVFLGF